jgi:hypothetical protein
LTHRWIGEVQEKLDSIQDGASRAGLQHRLCMLAATCFSTFDVCSANPAALASDKDLSIAMQCAVIVHDNTPPSLSEDNSLYLTGMLSRHHRLLHNLEPIFRQTLSPQAVLGQAELSHAGAYNDALSKLSSGYYQRNSASWHALPSPDFRWISCVTEAGQEVHYDLLIGELLIDGKRSGTLPQEIVEHPTYKSMFGEVSG